MEASARFRHAALDVMAIRQRALDSEALGRPNAGEKFARIITGYLSTSLCQRFSFTAINVRAFPKLMAPIRRRVQRSQITLLIARQAPEIP